MTTPTTGTVALVGGTSGMAPFPVMCYADLSATWATGSGEWPDGRWQFRLIDNGTGDTYSPSESRNAMTLTCPTNGHTASCFERYGAAPNAGCVIWDAGSYKWQVRYQNQDGDWSAWVDSSTVTVSADSRTVVHCRGANGSDANDGLSFANAKATLEGALGVVAGDNYKVILHDDETIACGSGVNLQSRSGIWVTRSYDGTSKPQITYNTASGAPFICSQDYVLDGVDIQPGSQSGGCVNNVVSAVASDNVAVCNADFGAVGSFMETGSTANPDGLLIYGGTQSGMVSRYPYYSDNTDRINILGVNWKQGSNSEHMIRIMAGYYVSLDFCDIVYSTGTTAKTALRFIPTQYGGAYRCAWDGGSISIGDGDDWSGNQHYADDMRFDCCRLNMIGTSNLARKMSIYETTRRLRFASCLIHRESYLSNPTITLGDRSGIVGDLSGIYWRNCWIYNFRNRVGEPGLELGLMDLRERTDVNLSDWKILGCILMSEDECYGASYQDLLKGDVDPSTISSELKQSVLFDNQTTSHDVWNDDTNYARDAAAVNALGSWAADNVDGVITCDPGTGALTTDDSQQAIVTDITGVFESLTAGTGYTTEIDRTLSAWDAGAVQRDALLVREATTTGTTFTDTNPGVGTHEYRVLAIVGYDEGDWSDTASVTFADGGASNPAGGGTWNGWW